MLLKIQVPGIKIRLRIKLNKFAFNLAQVVVCARGNRGVLGGGGTRAEAEEPLLWKCCLA